MSEKAPLLSILIPTRNRLELAKQCVGRLLADIPDQVELIILENSDNNSLSAVDFGNHPSVSIHPSASPLDMPSNWERGLSIAKGEYLTYIADKDMFLPSALRRFVDELATGRHEILCYRKAWFCDYMKWIYHYKCFGGVYTEELKPLLLSYFSDFSHKHSAPMIYNSAVSTKLVSEIKGSRDRFFIGTSPDAITGILFSAYRDYYSQMDETICVGFGGESSNGYAALRYGEKSPKVQEFIQMFKANPYAELHLPICMATGMLEISLKAKKIHSEMLSKYSVIWQRFLEDLHSSIKLLEISPQEKALELDKLKSWKCVVPRLEYLKFCFKPHFSILIECLWNRPVKLKMRLFPQGFGIARLFSTRDKVRSNEIDKTKTVGNDDSWWSNYQIYNTPADSISEALEIAAASNLHLQVLKN